VLHQCALLQELIPPGLPIISVSKGIEVTTGQLMSEVIPSVLGKKQPTVYLSGAASVSRLLQCSCFGRCCAADQGAHSLVAGQEAADSVPLRCGICFKVVAVFLFWALLRC